MTKQAFIQLVGGKWMPDENSTNAIRWKTITWSDFERLIKGQININDMPANHAISRIEVGEFGIAIWTIDLE